MANLGFQLNSIMVRFLTCEAVEKGILEETLNHVFLNLFLSLGVAKLYQTKKINKRLQGWDSGITKLHFRTPQMVLVCNQTERTTAINSYLTGV